MRGAHFSARTGSARAPPCRRRRALPFGTASPNIPGDLNLFTHFPVHGRLFCRGGPKVHLREKVRCPARGAEKDRDRDRHGDDYRDLKDPITCHEHGNAIRTGNGAQRAPRCPMPCAGSRPAGPLNRSYFCMYFE